MKLPWLQLTTARDRCWLLILLGFAVANFQLIGLALLESSPVNFVNCLVGLLFLGLVIFIRPEKT